MIIVFVGIYIYMPKSKKNTLAKSKKRMNGGGKKNRRARATLRRRPINKYAQPQKPLQKNQPQYAPQYAPNVQRIEVDQPPLGRLKDAPANVVNAAGIGLGGVFGANVGQAAFDGLFGDGDDE